MGITIVFCIVDKPVLFFGTSGIAAEVPVGGFGGIMVIAFPPTRFCLGEIPIGDQIEGNVELFGR